jgi:hypothetical protein
LAAWILGLALLQQQETHQPQETVPLQLRIDRRRTQSIFEV